MECTSRRGPRAPPRSGPSTAQGTTWGSCWGCSCRPVAVPCAGGCGQKLLAAALIWAQRCGWISAGLAGARSSSCGWGMQKCPRYSCPQGRCPPGSATAAGVLVGSSVGFPHRGRGLLALPPADYPTPPPTPRSFEAEGSPSRSQVVSVHRRLIYVIPLHAPVSPSPAPSRFPPAPEMSARHCAAKPRCQPSCSGHDFPAVGAACWGTAACPPPGSTATRVLPSAADAGIGFGLD